MYKNLKLESRISKLDNIVLTEPIDINILNKLINSDLLQIIINKFMNDTQKESIKWYPKFACKYSNINSNNIIHSELINNGLAVINKLKI